MDQYEEISISSGKNSNIFSIKFLELVFIFFIIFSVICKITNNDFIHYSGVLSKIINFIVNKLVIIQNNIIYRYNYIYIFFVIMIN